MQNYFRFIGLLICASGSYISGGAVPYFSTIINRDNPVSDSSVKDGICKGVVKDVKGENIIGASVVVKGSNKGTVTDLNGEFRLSDLRPGTIIRVSHIGSVSQEAVWNGNYLNFILKDTDTSLDELVVVGYGTQKKLDVTGAVSSVKVGDILGDRPLTNVSDALQGAIPGLTVSSKGNVPGAGKNFQIRGAYSLGIQNSDGSYGSTIAPLVLIDNVEGDIDMINPEDIETVSVLKDAASTAIYGARAAGGVILVTTKRPKGVTAFHLNYNNNFAFAKAVNLPQQVPLQDYLRAYSDAAGDQFWTMNPPSVKKWIGYLEQYQKDPSSFKTYGDGIYKDDEGGVYYLHEKDLVKNILETSFQQTHNISMSGGTDRLRYRLSGAYVHNNGVLITDKDTYRRMNVNGFISADVTKWFTQELTFSYANSKNTMPVSSLGERDIYTTRLASFYPEGNMPKEISETAAGLPFFTPANQIRWSNPSKTLNDNPRIYLRSILKPFKGFEAVFEYTFDRNNYDYHWYTGSTNFTTVQDGINTTPTQDYLEKTKQYTNYNAINAYGSYSFAIKRHRFKVMAGFNQESSYTEAVTAKSYGQAVLSIPSLGGGTSTLTANDTYSEYTIRGGFFRINYDFRNKYLLEVNGRYDGSSKFPKDSRFGFFPSISAGWNIAEEGFLQNTKHWLDILKLRISYGMIGNQNIPVYAYIPTMTINNKYNGWVSDGNYVTAVTSLPNLVSKDFTWEKVRTLDVGLDIALLQNRLTGSFDWFVKNTSGMLAPGVQLPGVVGADAPYKNTADMRTKGWDLGITWHDRIGRVGYTIGFNLSDAHSEITKYNNNSSLLLNTFYKGQQLSEIWGYKVDGFYTVDDFESTSSWKLKEGVVSLDGYNPMPGDVKFKNIRDDERGKNLITNGNNTRTNPGDQEIIGNTTPRYLYGINLGADYLGFSLNVFLQGTGKRDAWIANTLTFPLYPDFKFIPLYKGLENYWKPVDAESGNYTNANPNAKYPRIYGNYGNQASNYRVSDKYLSNAAYLRIKNVTLAYSFPKSWISRIAISQLKAFVSIENLATFSSLAKGIDPETLSWDYPSYRTISFGFNISL